MSLNSILAIRTSNSISSLNSITATFVVTVLLLLLLLFLLLPLPLFLPLLLPLLFDPNRVLVHTIFRIGGMGFECAKCKSVLNMQYKREI